MHRLASTDVLTGLGNRRRLVADLDVLFGDARRCPMAVRPLRPERLQALQRHVRPPGRRRAPRRDSAEKLDAAVGTGGELPTASAATSSARWLRVPTPRSSASSNRTTDGPDRVERGLRRLDGVRLRDPARRGGRLRASALRVADQRLYAQKYQVLIARGRPHAVLLQALEEREPALRKHVGGVARPQPAARGGRSDSSSARSTSSSSQHSSTTSASSRSPTRSSRQARAARRAGDRPSSAATRVIGQRILDASPALNEVGKIVRATHERWDGEGYPDGLAGAQIPLPARIIAVCDAYCAMIDERAYDPCRLGGGSPRASYDVVPAASSTRSSSRSSATLAPIAARSVPVIRTPLRRGRPTRRRGSRRRRRRRRRRAARATASSAARPAMSHELAADRAAVGVRAAGDDSGGRLRDPCRRRSAAGDARRDGRAP